MIEIVSNNVSDNGEVLIGNRRFDIRKPVIPITKANVRVLQMLDVLVNLDAYLDYTYEEARERFVKYISVYGITRGDVDLYINQYPESTFEYINKLELSRILT